jgi:hypothetical protein
MFHGRNVIPEDSQDRLVWEEGSFGDLLFERLMYRDMERIMVVKMEAVRVQELAQVQP